MPQSELKGISPSLKVPKVFISYSHDSPEHMNRVLEMSNRLRGDGIDCTIDQYEISPPEGWPRWTATQIEQADFVLVICTEQYDERFRSKGKVGLGLGVKWEGAVITQDLYDAEAHNTKFIPVVFTAPDIKYIPNVLRGATRYEINREEGYESLYRHLTNQPSVIKPRRGNLRPMPSLGRVQEFPALAVGHEDSPNLHANMPDEGASDIGEPVRSDVGNGGKNRSTPRSDGGATPNSLGDKHSTQGLRARSSKNWLVVALVIILAGTAGFALWRQSQVKQPQPTLTSHQQSTSSAVERTLTYWLYVKQQNDKDPFETTGRIRYGANSEFWFNVQTTQDGVLYLFGEGHEGGRPSNLNVLFPTKVSGLGDSRIAANTVGRVNKNPHYFGGGSGVVYLWIVWAATPVERLEEIIRNSFETEGNIRDPKQQEVVREFFENYKKPEPEVIEDELRFRVTLKGRGEILVHKQKLEYHP
jgi:hypothetical protein